MRRGVLLLTLVGAMLLACTGALPAQTEAPDFSRSEEDFADGEVLVKFKDGTSQTKKQEVHGEKGGRAKKTLRGIDVQVVDVPKGKEKAKAREYEDDPDVEFAEVNGVYQAVQAANEPNDPRATEQWQYKNTRYATTNKGDIDAYEAWNGGSTTAWDGGTTGSSSVAIAVLDTGIREDHEDLQGKVTNSVNYTNSSTNGDVHGHGTHVAGSAAALTNNQKGVAGTCPGCTLYNVKVLDDKGSGAWSWIANGITWAADNGAKVINMSLGGSGGSGTVENAVNYAWGKGVVVVAAAGNSNTNARFYPAAYPNVVAVGATDRNDAKASFSNYGSSWVDVAAPGVGILSTTKDGGYQAWNGTSMATPHVAGEAGLIWSTDLCITGTVTEKASCVRNQIEGKANLVSGSGTYWAKGRINANCAVSNTASEPCDTTAPTVSSTTPGNAVASVERSTNIEATFSEEMNPATLVTDPTTQTSPNVKLYQRVRKKIRKRWRWRWVPITATQVRCDNPCQTITVDPYPSDSSLLLATNRSHMVVITTGAKDKAGNTLAQNYSWTFTTGNT